MKFGKWECVDFGGEIGRLSLRMMEYKMLCRVKRFEGYERMGGVFGEVRNESVELWVREKIWGMILELVVEGGEG